MNAWASQKPATWFAHQAPPPPSPHLRNSHQLPQLMGREFSCARIIGGPQRTWNKGESPCVVARNVGPLPALAMRSRLLRPPERSRSRTRRWPCFAAIGGRKWGQEMGGVGQRARGGRTAPLTRHFLIILSLYQLAKNMATNLHANVSKKSSMMMAIFSKLKISELITIIYSVAERVVNPGGQSL